MPMPKVTAISVSSACAAMGTCTKFEHAERERETKVKRETRNERDKLTDAWKKGGIAGGRGS